MAVALTPGNPFGIALCKALGLDPKGVIAIDLHMAINDVVTVTVKRHTSQVEIESAIKVLELGEWKEQTE